MQKSERIGKRVVQVMVFFMIISIATFAIAAPPGAQVPSTHPEPELSFPDIKAMELRVDTLYPKAGDIIYFKGRYMVTGCVKRPFVGKITLDGTTLIEEEMKAPECIGSISNKAGILFDFEEDWKASPGTHTVVFTADSKNDIHEGPQNERNNTQTMTITVPLLSTDKIKDIKTKQPIPVPAPGIK